MSWDGEGQELFAVIIFQAFNVDVWFSSFMLEATEGIWEKGAEENIWTQEGWNNSRLEINA